MPDVGCASALVGAAAGVSAAGVVSVVAFALSSVLVVVSASKFKTSVQLVNFCYSPPKMMAYTPLGSTGSCRSSICMGALPSVLAFLS